MGMVYYALPFIHTCSNVGSEPNFGNPTQNGVNETVDRWFSEYCLEMELMKLSRRQLSSTISHVEAHDNAKLSLSGTFGSAEQ